MREAQGMPVWSLGSEDFLEEEMAIYSSILGLKIPWTDEPGRLHSKGSQSDTTEQPRKIPYKDVMYSAGNIVLIL